MYVKTLKVARQVTFFLLRMRFRSNIQSNSGSFTRYFFKDYFVAVFTRSISLLFVVVVVVVKAVVILKGPRRGFVSS